MKTETYTDPDAFLEAVHGAHRRAARHARAARPDIPRAAASERTGLTTLLKAGWHYTYAVGRGYRLTHPSGGDSGWCESERAACAAARGQVTP